MVGPFGSRSWLLGADDSGRSPLRPCFLAQATPGTNDEQACDGSKCVRVTPRFSRWFSYGEPRFVRWLMGFPPKLEENAVGWDRLKWCGSALSPAERSSRRRRFMPSMCRTREVCFFPPGLFEACCFVRALARHGTARDVDPARKSTPSRWKSFSGCLWKSASSRPIEHAQHDLL